MNIGYIFEKKDFWSFSPENFLVYDEFFPILLFLTISIVLALIIVSSMVFLYRLIGILIDDPVESFLTTRESLESVIKETCKTKMVYKEKSKKKLPKRNSVVFRFLISPNTTAIYVELRPQHFDLSAGQMIGDDPCLINVIPKRWRKVEASEKKPLNNLKMGCLAKYFQRLFPSINASNIPWYYQTTYTKGWGLFKKQMTLFEFRFNVLHSNIGCVNRIVVSETTSHGNHMDGALKLEDLDERLFSGSMDSPFENRTARIEVLSDLALFATQERFNLGSSSQESSQEYLTRVDEYLN